ncbi:MAG: type II secretion system F family protein [Anaerolineae bacterium]
MPAFEYEVAERTGALRRGRMEADSLDDLILQFRQREELLLSIRPERAPLLAGVTDVDIQPIFDSFKLTLRRMVSEVKLATILFFTGQLAAMLGGGIHLVRSLSILAAESTSKHFRKVLEKVRTSVTQGATLADALGEHPHIFSPLYVAIVRAGELSGTLPLLLNTLSTYLEKADQLRRRVRGAIAYPAVILIAAVVIVFVMIVEIVPIFERVYERGNARLPAPTLMLIAVSDTIRNHAVASFLAVLLLVFLFLTAIYTPTGRYLFDAFKLRLPLFGPLIRKAILARVCRILSVLLQAGIPLLEAMETVARVAGNRVVEVALLTAAQGVREGGTVAETLRQAGQFPGLVTQLATAGEESGTLPDMLGKAAVYYEQQVDNTVATLSSLIEPIMIVIMGAIVVSVILSLYLPIFTLGHAIRGLR